jgi:thermitase
MLLSSFLVIRATFGQEAGSSVAPESWEYPAPSQLVVLSDGRCVAAAELVIGIQNPVARADVIRRIEVLGGSIAGEIPRFGVVKVTLAAEADLALARQRYLEIPGVAYVEFNASGAVGVAPPDDEYFDKQWHLENVGQSGGTTDADVDALAAWEIQRGSSSIIVAVLDTGVNFDHLEFEGRLLPGWDFVSEDPDPSSPVNSHGIFVAGLLAANVDNDFQVAGMDQACMMLPLRVITDTGVDPVPALFNIAQGIDFAIAEEAAVVSISIVGLPESELLSGAIRAAYDEGVVVLAASGNTGGFDADHLWPAASPSAVTIGWTNHNDLRTTLSSGGTALDFVAPGKYTVTVGSAALLSQMSLFSGSSAATPIAAGIASLLLAENPFLTPDQVYEFIRLGADDQVGKPGVDLLGWDPDHGHGRVNAYQSLLALRSVSADGVLAASPPTLSLDAGGNWFIRVDAGAGHAGQPYVLLGSWSGTSGVTAAGVTWPLTLDRYFWHGLTQPNAEPLLGNVGVLDAFGKGVATLSVPGDQPGWMGGAAIHHAVAVFDGTQPDPLFSPPLLVSKPVAVRFDMPARIVFAEDFERGAPGWVFDNGALGLWHLAGDGECGSRSVMAAYDTGPASCVIGAGLPSGGVLRSPSFALDGKWPFTVSMSMIRGDASSGPITTEVRVVDETGVATVLPQTWDNEALVDGSDGTLQERTFVIPHSSKLMGRSVHLEFVATTDGAAESAGWLVDDVRVTNAGDHPPP